MKRRTMMIVAGALVALCINAAGFGQDSRQWNRKIDGVAVMQATPFAASATTDQNVPVRFALDTYRSWMDVEVVFSTEAWGRASHWYLIGTLDLSTDVFIHVNGEPVHAERFDTPPDHWTGSGGSPESQFTTIPVRLLLAPFDEITVELAPAPGAAREDADEDSVKTMTYLGNPIFWDRQIQSMQFEPGAQPGVVNVDVSVALAGNYDGWLDLTTNVVLLVNGQPANSLALEQRFWGATERPSDVWFLQCMQCNWACAFDGPEGRDIGYCTDGLPECVVENFNHFRFVGVAANAGDVVQAVLSPAYDSVPELEAVTTFDTMTRTVPHFQWPTVDKRDPRVTDVR